ncbi:hypothetical protein NC652_037830 [Populus alba x Populus x berolinensis]|nr:hypothetical protein NC652_037830 [Populus alba x Populus x berolinensis]
MQPQQLPSMEGNHLPKWIARSRRPAWTKKMKGMETVAVAFSGGEWRRMA